jgi:uncharacterized delta-60 repeat protein
VINSSTSITLNKNATLSGGASLTFSTPTSGGTARTGTVVTDFGSDDDEIFAVAIQSDGKIVAAGRTDTFGDKTNYDFALARYNVDGTLDTTFNPDGSSYGPAQGLVVTNFGGDDEVFGVVIQSDGTILAAGTGGGYFALSAYNPDGSFDSHFGTNDSGMVTGDGPPSSIIHAIAIEP